MSVVHRILPVSWLLAAPLAFAAEPALSPDTAGFAKVAQPFLREHCLRCHGPEKQKGNLRVDTMLPADFSSAATREKWAEVVNVLNSHEMPPKKEPQPKPADTARVVDWATAELARAELARRANTVVLRRMNRAEYNNTIRDLFGFAGVPFLPASKFPEDPPAGGFDNIGAALTLSPMQTELYYQAARQILDRALVEGPQPAAISWRFGPEENTLGMDRVRVRRDGNNILINSGKNPVTNGFIVVHHNSWDKGIGFRDFKLMAEGDYLIRIRAAGRVPKREQVVASAEKILADRRDKQDAKNPAGKKFTQQQMDNDLAHFQKHRMYDYGPPRLKISVTLGGQPQVIAELDVDAPESAPKVYEIPARFTKETAGVGLEYAYDIPSVLENFWMQSADAFARPELLVDWIELVGPIHPVWPPASHRRALGEQIIGKVNEAAQARDVLTQFMRRAFRRPVTTEEVAAKVALFEKTRAGKPSFTEAIKSPLAAVLASPHFLFLVEPAPAAAPRPLNAHELASRLSYFLWSSMPDDELFGLADKGDLTQPAVLRAQVNRMLKDARSEAFVQNFTGQWLGTRKVGANPPSKTLYPDYDRHLEVSMVRETESFFAEILRHDLDARQLIRSDFVVINERLARFYGIPGVRGDAFRRVPAPPESHRGGLVTQASIHAITSNGTRTSPVTRGVWVLRTLLGTDPGLPVANAGEIAPKVPGIGKATVRQRLQIHRELPLCARCHDKIDPLGFALENFNATGEWREQEGHGYNGRIDRNDPKIDARATMPDGTEFVGVEGLQAELLKKEDLFLTALAKQLHTYALGRELGFADQPMLRAAVAGMKQEQYTLRSLTQAVVASEAFRMK
ncbi:cytochrome c [Verrucomicrobiota bacterium]|nr:cytochrome c [Verrucomicrobiota bacterium]